MHNSRLLLVLCIGTAVSTFGTAYSQDVDLSSVYGKVNHSVVKISFRDENREPGSGVIIGITSDEEVIILTAHHVVENFKEVYVTFAGGIGEPYTGLVSPRLYTKDDDLAIVLVKKAPVKTVEVISFKETLPKRGQKVGTIGHPLDEDFYWTDGTISNIFGKVILHSAELRIGSSGGPLLDRHGRMLGINQELRSKPALQIDEAGQEVPALPDSVQLGTSVTLNSRSIIAILDGWFGDANFKDKWKIKKYGSFWERLLKDPVFWILEAGAIVGTYYWVKNCKDIDEPVFGEPPGPPN